MGVEDSPLLSSLLSALRSAFGADRCEFIPGPEAGEGVLVRDGDRPIGRLVVGRGRPLTPEEQSRVAAFAPLLARIVRHERLFQKATTDALTGLPDRDCFLAHFEDQDPSAPLALILIDPDHLKEKNEVYGRAVGDAILSELGELLGGHAFAARVGGEEFAILLPGAEIAQARDLAETLRAQVQNREFNASSEPVTCTVSLGVAARRTGEMPSALWARAEQALAVAKRGGRNSVEVAR